MLHTLRNVVNNDSLWFNILKGLQSDFRYKSVSTDEIVNYINQKTHSDYTYFFHEYLKYVSIPELQVSFQNENDKSLLNYRWVADEPNFRMPVKIKVGDGNFRFIYPTDQWQSMDPKNDNVRNVQVDKGFYVELSIL